MYYLKKILKNNDIKIKDISITCNVRLAERFCFHSDFKIDELIRIKKYLVERKIIEENFDIGNFLDIV